MTATPRESLIEQAENDPVLAPLLAAARAELARDVTVKRRRTRERRSP